MFPDGSGLVVDGDADDFGERGETGGGLSHAVLAQGAHADFHGAAADDGLVNINTADAAALQTLTGIGASRAQAIIDYRNENGSFESIEDIKKVTGIKDGMFAKIKDQIKVR